MLDRAVEVASSAGVSCTVEVDPASPPAEVILNWSAGHGLLAIGAPATTWLGGMLAPGGVALAAETSLGIPLLVARSTPAEHAEAGPILVASDGLDGSDQLVEMAGRVARSLARPAVLVHAVRAESGARSHRIEEQARGLERVMAGACEVRVEPGGPRTVIIESAAAVNASLVMMSSRRLTGLAAIGSVSRRVVHHGHCSVLLIPPEHLVRGQL